MDKLRVVITGTSSGMGTAIAKKFLEEGHFVYGIDVNQSVISDPNYTHYIADVGDASQLPEIDSVDILINNAGVQNSRNDMQTNFFGTKNCTEKYALDNHNIKSVLNQASNSATTGSEFGEYSASKGAVKTYSKWVAKQIAKYGATCNSISFGGVLSSLNKPVMNDKSKWDKIMSMTPLHKWTTVLEAAEWCYFLTVINRSATAQDFIVDNGETYNHTFVW